MVTVRFLPVFAPVIIAVFPFNSTGHARGFHCAFRCERTIMAKNAVDNIHNGWEYMSLHSQFI